MNTPKISFVIASRNDNYCGDSKYRLRKVLTRLISANGGLDGLNPALAEIIVVDWGSKRPLHDELWSYVKNGVRFLYVPKSVTDLWDTPFEECHALNLAARKARGTWIGRLDQDTVPGQMFFDWFQSPPEPNQVFFSGRRDLKEFQTVDPNSKLTPDGPINPDNLSTSFYRGAVGILLAPKSVWHECRGYDERLILRLHTEHDFIYRLRNVCPVADLGKMLDYCFYHLWHSREEGDARPRNPSRSAEQIAESLGNATYVNDSQWGLAAYDGQIKDSNP